MPRLMPLGALLGPFSRSAMFCFRQEDRLLAILQLLSTANSWEAQQGERSTLVPMGSGDS